MNRRDFIKLMLAAGALGGAWGFTGSIWRPPFKKMVSPIVPKRSATIMAVGDIMMHEPQTKDGYRPQEDAYDFSHFFQYMGPIFKKADLVMGNLETPLAGATAGYSGYPAFNAPSELATALKDVGFSLLTVTNNHSVDRGWKGLAHTLEVLQQNQISYAGAYLSQQDRDTPRIFEINGIKLGFLAYTYGLNGPAKPKADEQWRINFIDNDLILADLAGLDKAGADFKIVSLHFGHEYHRKPHKAQIKLVEELWQAGADLIIGHHPHVVQPGGLKCGPGGCAGAVYSLGNFISNQRQPYTNQGLLLDAKFGLDDDGRKMLGPLVLRPTRCHYFYENGRTTYRVIPLEEAEADPAAYNLTESQLTKMLADRDELVRHLMDYDYSAAK